MADGPAAPLFGPAASRPHESCTRRGQCRPCPRGLRKSVVLTSNCGLDTWLQFLGDEVLAAAVLDRFLHHATVFMPTLAAAAARPRRTRGVPLYKCWILTILPAGLLAIPSAGFPLDIHTQCYWPDQVRKPGAPGGAIHQDIGIGSLKTSE